MDIQQLIELDRDLLLSWNGSESLFWDGFMWIVSDTKTWVLAAIVLLYIIFKNTKFAHGVLILVMIALTITMADQFASGLCKPYFERFRPAQDPELMYLVDVVNSYRGGRYGFISSHAANTFAFALFISLLIRNGWLTWVMFLWAVIPSFSRIYLGVHYPGDVLCGALAGCVVALLVYWLYHFIARKYFESPQYISKQYTSSGFETIDIHIFYIALLVTCMYIIVAAMVVSKGLHF
ncbi:phosphatase PAP2 family protein [Phocaeicola salanitronis]|uniref:phosphatase PAP2 family protein n=1 Tax=Phocaeicola salanitronis TaxID=376805 RepID=UPI0025A4BAD7|nr:phosphatase PAP2 family protein [Phocaeicola salanitronis]MDM8305912.1 phosphatase PAP2 family protein [Phocaeicola salanitronis]